MGIRTSCFANIRTLEVIQWPVGVNLRNVRLGKFASYEYPQIVEPTAPNGVERGMCENPRGGTIETLATFP